MAGRPRILDQKRRGPQGNLALISGMAYLAFSGPQEAPLATARLPAVILVGRGDPGRPRGEAAPVANRKSLALDPGKVADEDAALLSADQQINAPWRRRCAGLGR